MVDQDPPLTAALIVGLPPQQLPHIPPQRRIIVEDESLLERIQRALAVTPGVKRKGDFRRAAVSASISLSPTNRTSPRSTPNRPAVWRSIPGSGFITSRVSPPTAARNVAVQAQTRQHRPGQRFGLCWCRPPAAAPARSAPPAPPRPRRRRGSGRRARRRKFPRTGVSRRSALAHWRAGRRPSGTVRPVSAHPHRQSRGSGPVSRAGHRAPPAIGSPPHGGPAHYQPTCRRGRSHCAEHWLPIWVGSDPAIALGDEHETVEQHRRDDEVLERLSALALAREPAEIANVSNMKSVTMIMKRKYLNIK